MNKNEFTMCLIAIIVVVYIHDNYYLSIKTKSRENFSTLNTGSIILIVIFVLMVISCSAKYYNDYRTYYNGIRN